MASGKQRAAEGKPRAAGKKPRTAASAVKDSSAGPNPVIGFGRLIRIALGPSAVSDVFVGIAIGSAGAWPASPLPWLLIPASLGVYHGAMALNDWNDRHEDARSRPDRPIPSGAIPAGTALMIGSTLLLGGILWAFGAGTRAGLWMAVVASLAVLYDLAGRGPLRGPLLLGLCRAGNLGAGLFSPFLVGASDTFHAPLLALAAAYGLHVFFISRLGRLEDEEDADDLAQRPTRALRGAGWSALAVPLAAAIALGSADLLGAEPGIWMPLAAGLALCAGVAGWNARTLLRAASEAREAGWTRDSVGRCTGLALRRLPLFALSIAAAGVFLGPLPVLAGAFAIVGARVSGLLRGVFPLT